MRLQTTRFGEIEVDERATIRFPTGILGFEQIREYVLLDHKEGSPFRFLQAVDDPALAFVVVDPRFVRQDYRVELAAEDATSLSLGSADEAEVYCIVTVPEDPAEMTVNLQAPVVVSPRARLGRQLVLEDGRYRVRHNVLAELQAGAFRAAQTRSRLRKTV